MRRDCLSGPRCCTGIDCRDLSWSPASPGWEMETAEGERVDGSFPPAAISGFFKPNHSAKWTMADGDQLVPPTDLLSGGAEAWFHSVELDGDADLTWDGGTIQLRGSTGTVTAGGHSAIIMPDDPMLVRTVITLYVTPTWYGVFVERFHRATQPTWPYERTITTRGSIQVIDRENNTSRQVVSITAVGDVSVYQWRVADASIEVEDDAITDRCHRPGLPAGTEANFQYHRAGTVSIPPEYPSDGTRTAPATVSLVGSVNLSVDIPYLYYDGTDTTEHREVYSGPFDAAISFGFSNPSWTDVWDSWHFTADGTGGIIATLGKSGVIRTASYKCCPYSPTIPIGYEQRASWHAGISSNVLWEGPTAANPYCKPTIRHRVTLQDSYLFKWSDSVVDVAINTTGIAPATLQVSHTGDTPEVSHVQITSAAFEWSSV